MQKPYPEIPGPSSYGVVRRLEEVYRRLATGVSPRTVLLEILDCLRDELAGLPRLFSRWQSCEALEPRVLAAMYDGVEVLRGAVAAMVGAVVTRNRDHGSAALDVARRGAALMWDGARIIHRLVQEHWEGKDPLVTGVLSRPARVRAARAA